MNPNAQPWKLRDPLIIGLTGRAGSGKDAAADHLCSQFGFVRAAFADGIRLMLEPLFVEAGVDYAHLYEPALKNRPIPEFYGKTARELMQTQGDWGRDKHPDWWVMLMARTHGLHSLQGSPPSTPVHDRIVITDVRFPNEAEWLARNYGLLYRMVRSSARPVRAHVSESHIDTLPVHAELHNDYFTLDGLRTLLDLTMAGLNVPPAAPVEG